jgi:hypothetical protein
MMCYIGTFGGSTGPGCDIYFDNPRSSRRIICFCFEHPLSIMNKMREIPDPNIKIKIIVANQVPYLSNLQSVGTTTPE